MRKLLLPIFVLLLLATTVMAVDTRIIPGKDEILPGETATYILRLFNPNDDVANVKLSFPADSAWNIITQPISHQTSLKIPPGESVDTTILITPGESVEFGRKHTYGFMIESNTENYKTTVGIDIFLRSPLRRLEYVPTVGVDVDVNTELDPRQKTNLYVTLKNFNPLNITGLEVELLSSINTDNNQKKIVDLLGLKTEKISFELLYDSLQPPDRDTLIVKTSYPAKNATFESQEKVLEILPYSELKTDTAPETSFLKNHLELSFQNIGNVNRDVHYEIRTSLFRQIFTDSEPKAEIVIHDGYRFLTWDFSLVPLEPRKITVTENYRPLFIIIILLLIAIAFYYAFRSAVVIKKQAVHLRGDKVKVLLHVKNRTGKIVENINVIDKVPRIGEVSKTFSCDSNVAFFAG